MNKNKFISIITILTLAAVLFIGLFTIEDYGLSTDEHIQRQHSLISYSAVKAEIKDALGIATEYDYACIETLKNYEHREYGVALQLPLVLTEDIWSHLYDEENVHGGFMPLYLAFRMRHIFVFLLYFVSLICFYFLLRRMFCRPGLAYVGMLMLLLFGRYYAHGFYNIKDSVCASFTIIFLLAAQLMFSSERRPILCFLTALAGAILITTRLSTALFIVFILALMLIEDIRRRRSTEIQNAGKPKNATVRKIVSYLLILCTYPIWLAITPASWGGPLRFSLDYAGKFSNYTVWDARIVYRGEYFYGTDIPRDYFVVWILLTVPIIYQLLCLYGIGRFAVKPGEHRGKNAYSPILWLSLLMIIATIGYQVITTPAAYNGWRQILYLYPLIIIFAVYGLNRIFPDTGMCTGTGADTVANKNRPLRIVIAVLLAVTLGFNAVKMAVCHPHQYAMFNVVGMNYATLFERDYWKLTYTELAKYLIENTEEETVKLAVMELNPDAHEIFSRLGRILTPEELARIEFCDIQEADYAIFDFEETTNGNEYEVEGFEEVYSIWVDKTKLTSIYKRIL